ncbi:hypothetical protein WJX79_009390 [Trebouxia sp. C0005]
MLVWVSILYMLKLSPLFLYAASHSYRQFTAQLSLQGSLCRAVPFRCLKPYRACITPLTDQLRLHRKEQPCLIGRLEHVLCVVTMNSAGDSGCEG